MGERRIYTFGGFEFDPASGELSREGRRVRLEPQPAKVLALLVERAGELVSRDELRVHLWGEETYVDFERGLRYCIAHVRGALGDSADSPRFIETLPRRGYRLLPPVASVALRPPERAPETDEGNGLIGRASGPAAEVPGAAPPVHASPPATQRRRLAAAVALGLAGASAVAAVLALRREPAAAAPVRLAVVAFDNETGMESLDPLARGLSDAAVVRLAAIDPGRLAVVGNAAELFLPRDRRELREIAGRLGVEYFVVGQVQGDAERVRVLVHLIRAADQAHLWATRVERERPDALDLERAVASELAAAIEERLLAGS